jgi:hypothetical protein
MSHPHPCLRTLFPKKYETSKEETQLSNKHQVVRRKLQRPTKIDENLLVQNKDQVETFVLRSTIACGEGVKCRNI